MNVSPRDQRIKELLATDTDRYFRDFVAEYEALMLRYAKSLGLSQQDAEECVSDGFQRVYMRLKGLDQEGIRNMSLKGYLSMTVRNGVIDVYRRQHRQPPTELLMNTPAGSAENSTRYDPIDEQADEPETVYLREEERVELRKELVVLLKEELPAQDRLILMARFFGEYTCQQIADLLQVPVSTVQSVIRRSLRRLHLKLRASVERTANEGGKES